MSLIARGGAYHSMLHAWLCMVSCALAAFSSASHAATEQERSRYLAVKIRPSYLRCLDAAGGVTPAIKSCTSDEFAFQDKRLNTAYKQLMAAVGDANRTPLKLEERQWIKHKESTCTTPDESGQSANMVAYDCALVQTATRATEIERRLTDPATYGAKPLTAGRDVLALNAKRGFRPSYQECIDSSFANNPRIIACADEELEFQESRIKHAREQQDARAAPAARASMEADQKQWADALDKQCEVRPGASQSEEVQASDCMLEGTATRANELEKLLAK